MVWYLNGYGDERDAQSPLEGPKKYVSHSI